MCVLALVNSKALVRIGRGWGNGTSNSSGNKSNVGWEKAIEANQ